MLIYGGVVGGVLFILNQNNGNTADLQLVAVKLLL